MCPPHTAPQRCAGGGISATQVACRPQHAPLLHGQQPVVRRGARRSARGGAATKRRWQAQRAWRRDPTPLAEHGCLFEASQALPGLNKRTCGTAGLRRACVSARYDVSGASGALRCGTHPLAATSYQATRDFAPKLRAGRRRAARPARCRGSALRRRRNGGGQPHRRDTCGCICSVSCRAARRRERAAALTAGLCVAGRGLARNTASAARRCTYRGATRSSRRGSRAPSSRCGSRGSSHATCSCSLLRRSRRRRAVLPSCSSRVRCCAAAGLPRLLRQRQGPV